MCDTQTPLFQAAKEQVDLASFLEAELPGLSKPKVTQKGLRFDCCPICGPRAESLKLSVRDGKFHCFSCGGRGSVVDAAAAIYGVDEITAAKRLVKSEQGSFPKKYRDYNPSSPEVHEEHEALREVLSLLRPIICRRDDKLAWTYLVGERCISPWVLERAMAEKRLGFLPSHPVHAKNFLVKHVGETLLKKSGLWKKDAKSPGICYRPIVSFMPCGGSAEFRRFKEEEPAKGVKAIRYGPLKYPWFWKGEGDRALVVEGVIDFYSAPSMGWKGHIIGVPGCNNWKIDWFVKCAQKLGIRSFLIGFDNDVNRDKNPGQEWAQKLSIEMQANNLTRSIYVPPAGDINDILKGKLKMAA